MSLKASFISFLNERYPNIGKDIFDVLISENLISPHTVSISPDQIESIKKDIKLYWELRNWTLANKDNDFIKYNLRKPENYSVCMSYDFHINSEGKPELIEINTNSAFLALGLELYSFLNINNPAGVFTEYDLIKMFQDELNLLKIDDPSIAIIDENPEQQKLFAEFLIYRELFQKHGWRSEIFDISQVTKLRAYSLIYNRYTDFYLQDEKSASLKSLYNEGLLNLSPNPHEYFLLADKQRLIDWNNQVDLEKPSSLLMACELLPEEKDNIWKNRKKYFFKPKSSYGSKQVYKGQSMSRKMFDEIYSENFVAQQLSVPSQVTFEQDGQKIDFKYDLRCFVYKNELQLIVARLYQGQTTNLQTFGGGFACVSLS